MSQEQDKQRKRKAMIFSVTFHALLAALFFFILAWREPDPPIPEYGIELNFGLDDVGSGSVQNPQRQEIEPEQTESTEQEAEETTEQVEESQEEEESEPSSVEEESVEDEIATAEEAEETVDPLPVESPDVVEEQLPEKEEVKETNNTETTEPEKIVSKDPVDTKADPKPTESTGENDLPDTSTGNDGDNKDEVGDKGDPEGSLDERALYGSPGSASGASLDLAGWNWDYLPKPEDTSNESGRIVFQITIDDQGYIIGIKTIEKTVTPAVEKIYRDEVSRLTFSPTSGNAMPAPTSTGKITFIIRTN